MKLVNPEKDATTLAFAKKAAEYFAADPACFTYASGDPTPGELFAVRWNPHTVLVLELSSVDVPLLYSVFDLGLKEDLPKLAPKW